MRAFWRLADNNLLLPFADRTLGYNLNIIYENTIFQNVALSILIRQAVRDFSCLSLKATSERGAPVFKTCERCSGNGFSGVPSTADYKAILKRVPDLHVRTWARNWKPFLEILVDV